MTKTNIPHLCGGIFLGLLLEARKPRSKARNKLNGGTDRLTSADVFKELVYVVTGDRDNSLGNTISKCVSSYKNCTSSSSVYIPFTKPSTQSAFDLAYKVKDPDIFKRMAGLIDTYLSNEKCKWLVRALIETMQAEKLDINIAINYSDSLKVSELHNADNIVFLPFIVSVLHYVVTNCPDCESGRQTFEAWYSQTTPKSEWKFISDIGNNIKHLNISMNLFTLPQSSSGFSNDNNVLNSKEDEVASLQNTINENEINIPKEENPSIIHQTVVNQYGDHPIHIDHVENLKL